MPVNTAKVQNRREVRYDSYEELLTDAERMGGGEVRQLGNWTAGQVFQHLANAFNGSIDGFQTTFPWYIRFVARLFKNKLLSSTMPPGIRPPEKLAEQLMPEPTPTEVGLANLRAAVARLKREPHRAPHPAFGAMSAAEWDKIHLSHARLHMSFLSPA